MIVTEERMEEWVMLAMDDGHPSPRDAERVLALVREVRHLRKSLHLVAGMAGRAGGAGPQHFGTISSIYHEAMEALKSSERG